MKPRASIPAIAPAPTAFARRAICSTAAVSPLPSASKVVMSRNWMPGLGKSGMVRMSALSSSAVKALHRPRSTLGLGLRLDPGPDLLLRQPCQHRGEDQEQDHDPAGLLALFLGRLGRPFEEGGHVLRHLVDRRLGPVGIGHLPVKD